MDPAHLDKILQDLSTAVIAIHAHEQCTTYASDVSPAEDDGTEKVKGITILVPHAADGVRTLRYAQHIKGIRKIVVGNSQESTVVNIKSFISHNEVQDTIEAVSETPNSLMYSYHKHRDRFDVVDLDVDEVTRYLDTAVQCVRDGGLLLVTCRDSSLSSGIAPDVCYARYGALVAESDCPVEMALRVVVKCVESHANRHTRYIQPVVCLAVGEGCLRVCLRVSTSPIICKQTLSKLSMVYHCTGCGMLTPHPLGLAEQHAENKKRFKFSLPRGPPVGLHCDHCQGVHKMGGPVWHAPLQCSTFIAKLCQFTDQTETSEHLQQLVAAVRDELHDVCFHYSLQAIHSIMPTVPQITMETVRTALHEFQVSSFHGCKDSIKTDAPPSVVWGAITNWVHQENVTHLPMKEPGRNILARYGKTVKYC